MVRSPLSAEFRGAGEPFPAHPTIRKENQPMNATGNVTGLDNYFDILEQAAGDAGYPGELVNTGGGTMVFFVMGDHGVSVGFDRESVGAFLNDAELDDDQAHWWFHLAEVP